VVRQVGVVEARDLQPDAVGGVQQEAREVQEHAPVRHQPTQLVLQTHRGRERGVRGRRTRGTRTGCCGAKE